ncbi:hypothetical protein T06_1618 [Trichinella sp. T6]|nr:hypothetical protein T06_1618 [Trichinella sp. T6]
MHPTLPTFIQNFHSDFAFHSKANVLLAIIRGNDVKTSAAFVTVGGFCRKIARVVSFAHAKRDW